MSPVPARLLGFTLLVTGLFDVACGKFGQTSGVRPAAASAGLQSHTVGDADASVKPRTLVPLRLSDDCVPASAGPIQLVQDLTYAKPDGQALALDLAWPKRPGIFPLVVVVHGGDFVGGDKGEQREAIVQLANEGFAAAAVNYRLSGPGQHFPAPLQDLRCAVRWLRAKSAAYHIDPSRVAVTGDGAGATLAALLGTAGDLNSFDHRDCPISPEEQTATVSGVIANGGRSDLHLDEALNPPQSFASIRRVLGIDLQHDSQAAVDKLVTAASPITYVSQQSAPFLLLNTSKDPSVLPVQNILFKHALAQADVPVTTLERSGVSHTLPLFSTQPAQRESYCTAHQFLRLTLAP